MAFPKRFRRVRPPEYEDLELRILANPTGVLYDALLSGDASTPDRALALGAALSEVYASERVEAYGVVFDFSTAETAMATIQNEAVPVDLRAWLRNAPIDLVVFERGELGNDFRASLIPGN